MMIVIYFIFMFHTFYVWLLMYYHGVMMMVWVDVD